MNRRAEALNPAAEQTLRAPKYEASSIFTLVAQSERYLSLSLSLSLLSRFGALSKSLNPLLNTSPDLPQPEVSKPLGSQAKELQRPAGGL